MISLTHSLETRADSMVVHVCIRVFMWAERNLQDGGGSVCVSGSAMQGLWENYELSSYVMRAHSGQA